MPQHEQALAKIGVARFLTTKFNREGPMTELVIREDKDGVAKLTLNRPEKLNALTVGLFQELKAHVDAIREQTDSVGVVLLTGAGRAFSAGNDLGAIAAGETPPYPAFQSHIIAELANLPQPVITAVHGACFTGGLELALSGDIILASENAKFGDTHSKFALSPVWGMSQRLPRRVGRPKAAEMMFTSRTIGGREAEAIGLANICYADETYQSEVDSFCAGIAANSWFSHRANKSLLLETEGKEIEDGLAHEIFRGRGRGPDMEERIAAFNKR